MRYSPDHKGFARLMVSGDIHKLAREFAEEGERFAVTISPAGETKEYRNSFRVQTGLLIKMRRANSWRAFARLHNDADHAAAVEWRHGHAVLTRTAAYLDGWHP